MHAAAIESFVKKFREIAAEAEQGDEVVETHYSTIGSVKFTRKSRVAFETEVRDFLKKSGCDKVYSFKTARKDIIGYLASSSNDSAEEYLNLQSLVAKYKSHDKINHVYHVVQGLRLGEVSNLFEGKVRIFICGEAAFAKIILESGVAVPDNAAAAESYHSYIADLRESLLNKVVMEYGVNAEPERAKELAFEEFSRIIDILRYAGKAIEKVRIDIRLAAHSTRDEALIIGGGGLAQHYSAATVFYLDIEALNLMQQIKCREIYMLQQKPSKKLTDLEERVLRAVKWFSSAVAQEHDHVSYLHYVLALESLFTSDNPSEGITATISDSVAFLLSNRSEKRTELKRKVKKVYSVRSSIAHGASHTVGEEDLDYVAGLTEVCIRVIIERLGSIKTREELTAVIEKLKYYGDGDLVTSSAE